MSEHTKEELHTFAVKHAPKLAEEITRLCGAVISKGMVGILEEVCSIKAQRDELLAALKDCTTEEGPDQDTLNRARAAITKAEAK